MSIHGLGDSDARALLLDNVYGPLDAAVCDQIITESHGNPLALLELPRTWRAADLAGGFGLPGSQLVASKIEQSYVRRLRPTPLRDASCSCSPRPRNPSATLCCSTVQRRRSTSTWLQPPRRWTPGCSTWEGAWSSPIRSSDPPPTARPPPRTGGAYIAPSPKRPTPRLDPDRRAWHRARATPGPDEEVAAELEHCAGRAQTRGGLSAAAAFLTRATELTPDPARRVQRALHAALANVQAGTFDIARTLISTAGDGPVDEAQRAQIDLLRAQLAFVSSRGTEATTLLLAAAQRLEPLDINLARETYLDAFSAALFGARLNDTVGVPEIARAARAVPRRPGVEPTAADLLLDGLVALTDDYQTGVPLAGRRCRNSQATAAHPRRGCVGCGRAASSLWSYGTTRARTACRTTTYKSLGIRARSAN